MKSGQTWYPDYILAIVIVTAVFIMLYQFMPLVREQRYDSLQGTHIEAKEISGILMSEGYPHDWNRSNAVTVGLLTGDHMIDVRKVNEFGWLSTASYAKSKTMMGIRSDYLIYFTDDKGRLRKMGDYWTMGSSLASVTTDAASRAYCQNRS
jgi:hypothetical protein